MKARIKWVQDVMFVAESGSGHSVVIDGAPEAGGRNFGIRPMEMMLIGLGSCSAFDVLTILKRGREQVTDCVVELDGQRADTDPKVFTAIELVLHILPLCGRPCSSWRCSCGRSTSPSGGSRSGGASWPARGRGSAPSPPVGDGATPRTADVEVLIAARERSTAMRAALRQVPGDERDDQGRVARAGSGSAPRRRSRLRHRPRTTPVVRPAPTAAPPATPKAAPAGPAASRAEPSPGTERGADAADDMLARLREAKRRTRER